MQSTLLPLDLERNRKGERKKGQTKKSPEKRDRYLDGQGAAQNIKDEYYSILIWTLPNAIDGNGRARGLGAHLGEYNPRFHLGESKRQEDMDSGISCKRVLTWD